MTTTDHDLTPDQVARRLASGNWAFDPELRLWIDLTDAEQAVAYTRLRQSRLRAKHKQADSEATFQRDLQQAASAIGMTTADLLDRVLDRHAQRRAAEAGYAAVAGVAAPQPEPTERKTLPLSVLHLYELKASTGDEGIFRGWLAAFGNEDEAGDIIEPTAFDASLADLKAHPHSRAYLLPLLFQHDTSKPIGGFTELRPDSRGLAFTARINLGTQLGADVYSNIKAGVLSGMSIGYIALKSHRTRSGTRILDVVRLLEGSVVTKPANAAARILDPNLSY